MLGQIKQRYENRHRICFSLLPPNNTMRMIQMNVGSNKLTQEVFLNAVV